MIYKSDCIHFRGDIPCKPHKHYGYHCKGCPEFIKQEGNILIIKLGAIGDVIRTTTLISKLKSEYPNHILWWLTYSPDVLPDEVEKSLAFNLENTLSIQGTEFEMAVNLDKDHFACALFNTINSKKKCGYYLKNGKPAPIDSNAEKKFITGIFDDNSKENTKSYPQEIFEVCGWKFKGEEYILNPLPIQDWNLPNDRIIVGLNTGCGERWTSRLWKDNNWLELINLCQQEGYYPVLLGGKQEHEKNTRLSKITGTFYPGYFDLKKFFSLVNSCDIVVTAVTMALHVAIGFRKQVVLLNNIFNPHEFELYGRGEIIQPEKECKCYFSPRCKNEEYFCLDYLSPETVYKSVKRRAGKIGKI